MSSHLPSVDNTSGQSIKTVFDSAKNGKPPHGIENFLHGILYQIKISLYYAIFAWLNIKNKEDFCVASELPNGGILDDFVLARRDRNGNNIISLLFLQAKHSLERKAISYSELIKDTSPFSITAFFKSYKLIKGDPIYSLYILDKCILCSNAPLSEKLQNMMLKITDGNEFFLQGTGELWKFNSQSNHIAELRDKLKKTTNFDMILVKLLHCVLQKKKIDETNGIFSVYHVALFKERILDKNKFHNDFIENKDLSANAKRFRRIFIERFIIAESEGRRITKAAAKEILRKMWLDMSAKFGRTPPVLPLEIFDADGFAKELYSLIKQNVQHHDRILYNKSQNGRRGKTGKNQIDLSAQYVFVYGENKKTFKFRKSFFEDNFASIVDHLDIPEKNDIKKRLLQFKKSLLTCCLEDNLAVNKDILMKCRFKMVSTYLTVCETEKITLPSNRDTTDEEINEFFDNFYFAINQPNETTLKEMIDEKLSKIYNLSDVSLVSSFILEKAIDWAKNHKSKSLDGVEIGQWLKDGEEKMANLGIRVQTETFRRILASYGNDHVITELKEFLNDSTKRILWLSTRSTKDSLTAIASMIPATLKAVNKAKFSCIDNYILNSLSTLAYSQEGTLAFYETSATSKDKPLIVVELDDGKDLERDEIIEFAEDIAELISNNNLQQLVIVAKPSSIFAKQFKKHVTKENVSFKDYNHEPSKKRARLQGNLIRINKLVKNNRPLMKTMNTHKKVLIGRRILHGEAKNHRQATFTNGKINVIEVGKSKDVKQIMDDKAAMIKDKFPSKWVVTVSLKTVINKSRKNDLSPKKLLSDSMKKQYSRPQELNQKIFEHMYDNGKLILIIDGSRITKNDVHSANELLDQWDNGAREMWIVIKHTISRQVVVQN